MRNRNFAVIGVISWTLLSFGNQIQAAERDNCFKIEPSQFNPIQYSTPSCTFPGPINISSLNACALEVQNLADEVSASWDRAYAAAKEARDRCFAEADRDNAIQKANDEALAAANGSIAGQAEAYLRGEALYGNIASLERVREVAALVSSLHKDLFGSLDSTIGEFTSDPGSDNLTVRSNGNWAFLAHPPTLAQVNAERQSWLTNVASVEAQRAADAQNAAEMAAEPSSDENGMADQGFLPMLGNMGGPSRSSLGRNAYAPGSPTVPVGTPRSNGGTGCIDYGVQLDFRSKATKACNPGGAQ